MCPPGTVPIISPRLLQTSSTKRWLPAWRRRPALGSAFLRQEALVRRADEAGQRLDVVAALQHGRDARREPGRPARELAKAVVGHLHLRERIVDVRVEPRR